MMVPDERATTPPTYHSYYHTEYDTWHLNADGHYNPFHVEKAIELSRNMFEAQGHDVVALATSNLSNSSHTNAQDYLDTVRHLKSVQTLNDLPFIGPCAYREINVRDFYELAEEHLDGVCGSDAYLLSNYGKTWDFDPSMGVADALRGAERGLDAGVFQYESVSTVTDMASAFDGVRLGYADGEHEVAAVYRSSKGAVQLFSRAFESSAGVRVVALDREVVFDSHGPVREYHPSEYELEYGGAINISWGEDIPWVPSEGNYLLVNKNSNKVMVAENNSLIKGTNLVQADADGSAEQFWHVAPSDRLNGVELSLQQGDANLSLQFEGYGGKGSNVRLREGSASQGLLYDGDGWFYLCHQSAVCVDVQGGTTDEGANIFLWSKQQTDSQLWSFESADAAQVTPDAPTGLTAFANPESVVLKWDRAAGANSYQVYRAERENGRYNTIARDVTSESYVDSSVVSNTTYLYKVAAAESVAYVSEFSNEVQVALAGPGSLIAHYSFNDNVDDLSVNQNHAAPMVSAVFEQGIQANALVFADNQYLQLPYSVAKQEAITIAAWVYWDGGESWQRIFDFGNGEEQTMFLTPRSESGLTQFTIKNGDISESLVAGSIPVREWTHVAVTVGAGAASLYINGELKHERMNFGLLPSDVDPSLHYIGRSQYLSDPVFEGRIDEIQLYNYTLAAADIERLLEGNADGLAESTDNVTLSPADNEVATAQPTDSETQSEDTEIASAADIVNANTSSFWQVPDGSEVPSIKLYPESPTSESSFYAVNETLPYGDFEYSYHWIKNGEVFATTTESRLDQSGKRGDVISVALVLSTNGESVSRQSAEVTVINSAPRLTNLELLPANATNNDDLYVEYDAVTDADGDEVEISYLWYVDYQDGPLDVSTATLDQAVVATAFYIRVEVEVADGMDVRTYKRYVYPENYPNWFYQQGFQAELNYGETTEFNVGFIDANGDTYDAELHGGPAGLTLSDGLVSWTPSHAMLAATETHRVYFASPFGQVESLAFLLKNPDYSEIASIEHDALYGSGDNISIAGWANDAAAEKHFVFVHGNEASSTLSVGVLKSDGEINLTEIGNGWERPLHGGATLSQIVDSDDDGIEELLIASSKNSLPAIQHRRLDDLSLIASIDLGLPYLNKLFTWDPDKDQAWYLPDEKILYITGLMAGSSLSGDFAFTTLTKWRNRSYPVTPRLHVYNSDDQSFTETEIGPSAFELNVLGLDPPGSAGIVVHGFSSRYDRLGKWTFENSEFSFSQSDEYTRCSMIEKQGSHILCLEIDTDPYCQAYCYGHSSYAKLHVLNSELELVTSSELWSNSCYYRDNGDVECTLSVSYTDEFEMIGIPSVIALLNSEQLVVIDDASRLLLVAINSGRITWMHDTPIDQKIKEISCQENSHGLDQCVFLGDDGVMYSVR